MYVLNDATLDSRVRREAATIAADGWRVTLVAMTGTALPEREIVDGFEIVRVEVPGGWRRHWLSVVKPGVARSKALATAGRSLRSGPRGVGPALRSLGAAIGWLGFGLVRRIALLIPRRLGGPGVWPPAQAYWLATWRWSTLGWARAAVDAAPVSDVHHGHDLTALAAARAGARRDHAKLVYDSHEIFVDSGRNADRPRWARSLLRRWERRWSAGAAALVSVNEAYAKVIAKRIKAGRVVVVHNCPPKWAPDPEAPVRLRRAAGIDDGAPIVLYHGAFSRHRGMEQLAEAMLDPSLVGAHLVFLGYGGERAALDAMAADPRFGGRLHVLDAVPPERLLGMVAGADVDAIPLQHSTLNHWLCTPNKLFESIAAGVPVLVSEFPVMRDITLDPTLGPLGAVCAPEDPAAIAAAIAGILTLAPSEREALRARCRAAADERWNWERESQGLLALYRSLAPER